MARDIAGDIRLDPRVKAFQPTTKKGRHADVDSREALLAEANSAQARAGTEDFKRFMERFDTEEAPRQPACASTLRSSLAAGRQHHQPPGDPPGR